MKTSRELALLRAGLTIRPTTMMKPEFIQFVTTRGPVFINRLNVSHVEQITDTRSRIWMAGFRQLVTVELPAQQIVERLTLAN